MLPTTNRDMTRYITTFARNDLAEDLENIAKEMSSPNCNSQTMLELTLKAQQVVDAMKVVTLAQVIQDLA